MFAWRPASRRSITGRISNVRQYSEGVPISQFLRQQPSQSKSKPKSRPTTHRRNAVQSPAEIERATRIRHLLRAILRECTYLPDAWARQWTKHHAIARFRTYQWKAWKDRRVHSLEERLMQKESEARESLTLLRRANEGERSRLLRVMLMAYGRTGRRRHELMAPLLWMRAKDAVGITVKDEDVDGASLTDGEGGSVDNDNQKLATDRRGQNTVENCPPVPSDKDAQLMKESRELDLPPQLRALVISQIKTAPPSLTRPNPRRVQPSIPDFNSWHRPMPQSRIKNLKKKHYRQLIDRILPPLPSEEWYQLRELASGRIRVKHAPQRRTPAGQGKKVTSSQLPDSALAAVVKYGKAPKKMFEQHKGHAITSRFMRRLYAELFRQCPLMELSADNTEWIIRSGDKELDAMSRASREREADISRATQPTPTDSENGLANMPRTKPQDSGPTSLTISVGGGG